MSGVTEETWARLRRQVEVAQGETVQAAESRLRREFRAAVVATGWDGQTCCADPHKVYRADPAHVYRVLGLWRALVREEYRISGDLVIRAEPALTWAFNAGCAPWDARVTRVLAEAGGRPVWTRRAFRIASRSLRELLAA